MIKFVYEPYLTLDCLLVIIIITDKNITIVGDSKHLYHIQVAQQALLHWLCLLTKCGSKADATVHALRFALAVGLLCYFGTLGY